MLHCRLPWATVLVAALLADPGSCPAIAWGAEIKAGDVVVTMKRARVAQGEKAEITLGFLAPGTELAVSAVEGNWVESTVDQEGKKVKGWIHVSELATKPDGAGKPKTYPRELSMRSLPAYRIAPPDVIQIEMLKLVRLPPYRAEVFDVLQVRVANALADQPIDSYYIIELEGTLDLGPAYGRIPVAGLTMEEIKRKLDVKLREVLHRPEVSVQLARLGAIQPVSGQYIVGPDGTINLRQYGVVAVAGKSVAEARAALEKHLAGFFDSPEVGVEVIAFNSKVYYVIVEGTGMDNRVLRLPITGNETVLDAVSQVGPLRQIAHKKIWLARATPPGAAETVLPVDWEAVIHRGAAATNYQICPGDRIVIADQKDNAP
jgi:polysaccharide export outer membrane protein